MKRFYLLSLIFLCLQLHSQITRTSTGASYLYGTSRNNDGIGAWVFPYGGNSSPDTSSILYESPTALCIEGKKTFPLVNVSHTGFVFRFSGEALDLSNPDDMMFKVRMRNVGDLHVNGIAIKLGDTLGAVALSTDGYIYIDSLENEFKDYYINLQGKWYDPYVFGRQVDSANVSVIDIYFDWSNTTSEDFSGFKIEIEEIEIGSAVDWSFKSIRGKLFTDLNNDCVYNGNDIAISNGIVKAMPGGWYAVSNEQGDYELRVDSAVSQYTVTRLRTPLQTELLVSTCPANDKHVLNLDGNDVEQIDFAEKSILCARPFVTVSSDRRRRCFRSNTTVLFGNYGTSTESDVEIRVVFPDYVEPISSTPAWDRREGKTLFYTIGTLVSNQIGSVHIVDSVICGDEGIRGLTQCTRAFISPVSNCTLNNPSWDLSDVQVSGECISGVGTFTIANNGAGTMSDSLDFYVYENDTLIHTGKFKLASNESFKLSLPADGNFLSAYVNQVPFHPSGESFARAFLEGCIATGNVNIKPEFKGLLMNMMVDDSREESAIACDIIRDSYDPNDKAAVPAGKGDAHYVLAGTKLNYKIRFENTGSDTAYKVVVIDTLDANLDISTFQAGAGSHVYKASVSGTDKVVYTFSFYDINLPPKSTDSIGCHGFISFSINALPTLVDETTISNKAEIYFDYNSAIVTNTVTHTIGDPVEYTDLSKGYVVTQSPIVLSAAEGIENVGINVYPNPSREFITIKTIASGELVLLNSEGREIMKEKLKTGESSYSVKAFPAGLYYYRISDSNGNSNAGKFLKID